MKKPLKITLIVIAVLAGILLVAAVAVSPVAKRYIERHDRELLGRSIRMERLRFNLFTGRLRITDLRIGGAEDSTTFFRLDSFDMRMRLWPLLARRIDVRRIAFTGPDLKIYQQGTAFSFDDILDRFRADTTATPEPAEPAKPWEVGIYDISIRDGHIFYKDLLLDATWGLNDVNLTIPGVYFSGAKTDVGAVLNFAEGGSLETRVAYDIERSDFDIGIRLRELALDGMLPYFRQSLDVTDVDGRLSADVRLQGDLEHLLSLRASGEASLAGFALYDAQHREVAAVDTLALKLTEGDLGRSRFRFEKLYMSGFSALVELTPEGDNISALMRTAPAGSGQAGSEQAGAKRAGSERAGNSQTAPGAETAAEEPAAGLAPAPTLQIADLEIARGSVTLRDRTLHRPFEYRIGDIRMHSRNFDPAAKNNLLIEARMQQTGQARLRWEGTLDGLDNQNITLWLSNVALADFGPYCEHYTAYPLTHGNLTFRSQNIIRNRHLDGTNHLDLFEPEAAKKRKDLKPEMHIPLKLGLYVLKDKKGHVKMDLPVKGSLDSPEFSYRKIVMKAIGNVLLKVVTAPFSFLGGHKDNLEYIALDPQQYAFTSEQYASLDRIAQLLQEKPEMQIVLTQRLDLQRALPAQAANALRMAYAAHLQGADSAAANSVHPAIDGTAAVPASAPVASDRVSAPSDATRPVPTPSALPDSAASAAENAASASGSSASASGSSAPVSAHAASRSDNAAAPAARPRLSMIEYERLLQLDIRTPGIMAFADSLLTARGIAPHGLSAGQKARTLFGEQAARQLRQLMSLRDRAVAEYMLSTHRLAAPAFRLEPLDSAALESYTGRDRYTISLEVEGERVEIGGASDADNGTAPDAPASADGSAPITGETVTAGKTSASGEATIGKTLAATETSASEGTATVEKATAASCPGPHDRPDPAAGQPSDKGQPSTNKQPSAAGESSSSDRNRQSASI